MTCVKRLLCIITAVVLFVSMLSGCGSKKNNENQEPNSKDAKVENLNVTGMPIVNTPITLKIFTSRGANQAEFSKMLIWQEYEKMTGIKIDWIEATTNLGEKKNLTLASGDLPDVFFKSALSVTEIINYGSQGTFLKLNDMVDKYGPSIKKTFDRLPDVKKGMTMPDGGIYTLPYIDEHPGTLVQTKIYINQKWLDNLSLKMPETTDDMYQILKAFKEKDPNKNGLKDEVPYTTPNAVVSICNMFSGSFGLMNRGNGNIDLDMDEKTGKVRFIPAQPEYRELLQYLSNMYSDGLIDKEIFTIKQAQVTAKADQGILGAINGPSEAMLGTKNEDDYAGLETVLKGPSGHQILGKQGSAIRNIGSFAMTSANKYPEATMRWVDYFYSDEGIRLYFMGVEGKTYKVVNGQYEYVDDIANNPNGLSPQVASSQYLSWNGGDNPTIVNEKYFKFVTPKSMKVASAVSKYAPKEVWSPFIYTSKENETMLGIKNDINTYVNEMRDQFVAGKIPLAYWDEYLKKLNQIGLEEYMKINQAAYERYSKSK